MDRDTLRLSLLAIGALVILGIYLWHRFKPKLSLGFLHPRKEFEALGLNDPPAPPDPPATEDDDLFDSLSYRGRKEPAIAADGLGGGAPEEPAAPEPRREQPTQALGAPFLIQISVVAGRGRFFRGDELRDALLELDLIHGEMGIFHRYDRQFRQTLFSVASLVEPGTFPMEDMESFECPGVVLFFQTGKIADPVTVYDDLVHTAHELASRLDGSEWDEARQPLSAAKVAHMRALLRDAVEDSP